MSLAPGAAKPFLVIGHRGAKGHAPENTLASIARALELGADFVEIDVQLHRGELLVLHDLRLERTTDGTGRLAERDLAYLRRLDAGGGQGLPTLPQVLDLVDRRAGVNVELKIGAGTTQAVATVLAQYLKRGWRAEQFLVSSFIHPELLVFRELLPQVPVGALLMGVPLDLAACATRIGAAALNISDEFAEPALIEDARRRGLKIYVYTVNHPDEIARFRALGVDGIFTDYPDRARGGEA